MVLLESGKVGNGTLAPDFNLTGADDKKYSLNSFEDAKVLVIIFMCNHCPYVQSQWDRFVDLQKKFEGKGVRFAGINSNFNPDYPEDSFEKMKEYVQKYNMNFPYLQDDTQEVARAYGAVCTPDIFVYDSEKKLIYHGRLDDNWQNPEAVTRNDLEDAIWALTNGEIPAEEQFPSMGCSIKWRN